MNVEWENDLSRFGEISEFLMEHRYLWGPRPFVERRVSWEKAHPDLADNLRGLEEQRVEELEKPGASSGDLHPLFQKLEVRIEKLTCWKPLLRGEIRFPGPMPKVAERKIHQIGHFVEVVLGAGRSNGSKWLDWCSGKGHLGRVIAQRTGEPVICVEKEPALCTAGEEESKDRPNLGFHRADVLEDEVDHLFDKETFAVALHACGDLGMSFLRRCVAGGCPSLALAPCCYQKVKSDFYVPMSRAGREHPLPLTRHHLRLACFDEVVASSGRRELRRREQAWRLAADTLIRRTTGRDEYTPLGSFPRRDFGGTFANFIGTVSRRVGLDLPCTDLTALEKEGERLLVETRALGLLRGMFKRAVESWLVLDRVLFLAENGYLVRAGEFCPFNVTPRNLMIIAQRR